MKTLTCSSTHHYFGAYLKIITKQAEKSILERNQTCDNGHLVGYNANYCQVCGAKLDPVAKMVKTYPLTILDIVEDRSVGIELANIFEDVPRTKGSKDNEIITFPRMFSFGTCKIRWDILWLMLDGNEEITHLDFPTDEEVKTMIKEFKRDYDDILKVIETAEHIETVEVKAGYVLVDWGG